MDVCFFSRMLCMQHLVTETSIQSVYSLKVSRGMHVYFLFTAHSKRIPLVHFSEKKITTWFKVHTSGCEMYGFCILLFLPERQIVKREKGSIKRLNSWKLKTGGGAWRLMRWGKKYLVPLMQDFRLFLHPPIYTIRTTILFYHKKWWRSCMWSSLNTQKQHYTNAKFSLLCIRE